MKKVCKRQSEWKKIIEDIELAARKESAAGYTKKFDYSVVLPDYLRQRVRKIIPYEFDQFDRNVFVPKAATEIIALEEEDAADDNDSFAIKRKRLREKMKESNYDESTCSDVERWENEYPKFDLKFNDSVLRSPKEKSKKKHWLTAYLCKPQKERVVWNSKIYKTQTKYKKKNLDEQAEELMDASADQFVSWYNALGRNHESDLTKEQLKTLFSIEGDRKLQASILTEPKEVKAIAQTVAEKWNLPEMAMELKYENYIQKCLKDVPTKLDKVAFGRTIPEANRPWIPNKRDRPVTTVYPTEILTGEKLFKGIGSLRTTQTFVKFCHDNPDIPRPKYLVDSGHFKKKFESSSAHDVPLYDLWKLKY